MHFRPSRPANCWPRATLSDQGSSPFARPYGSIGSVSRSGSRRNRLARLVLQWALIDRALRLPCAPLPVASVQVLVSLLLQRRKHYGPLQPLPPPFSRHVRKYYSKEQELWSFD